MNKKVIAVYLDDSQPMEIELSWLYKTWILHGLDEVFDIVVYHHPKAESWLKKIKDRPQVITIEMKPLATAEKYKFLNSRNIFLDPYNQPLQQYEYVLATDCDCFLTQHIKNIEPQKMYVGQGGYCAVGDVDHLGAMSKLCNHFSFEHQGLHNIGSSYFGKMDEIMRLAKMQVEFTEFLLSPSGEEIFWADYKKSHKGVSSMLGGEMSVNYFYREEDLVLNALDAECNNNKMDESVIHIHAWHTIPFWSKHQFFQKSYAALRINFIDAFSSTGSYCHWIATTPIEEIKRYRDLLLQLGK